MTKQPDCVTCTDNGLSVSSVKLAPMMVKTGRKNINSWVPVCQTHADQWRALHPEYKGQILDLPSSS